MRNDPPHPEALRCSFCGNRSQKEVRKRISGPEVFVCDECVHLLNQILDKHELMGRGERPTKHEREVHSSSSAPTQNYPSHPEALRCSFCGKSQHEVRKLISGPEICVCDECVRRMKQSLDEEGELGMRGERPTLH